MSRRTIPLQIKFQVVLQNPDAEGRHNQASVEELGQHIGDLSHSCTYNEWQISSHSEGCSTICSRACAWLNQHYPKGKSNTEKKTRDD